MNTLESNIDFFVKVEGRAFSNHRNPEGIYGIKVTQERTVKHSACAALNVAKDYIPFLDENIDNVTLRVFDKSGDEIIVPSNLNPQYEDRGLFTGRSKNPPTSITLN